MSDHDYGPLRTYEITWRGRQPENVQGHQVTFDSMSFLRPPGTEPRFHIHGMFPGKHWRLVITGLEADICIRDITEQLQALEDLAADGGQP